MSYLEDLQEKLSRRDYNGFLQLWEEYCHGDTVDPKELAGILKAVKHSDFVTQFDRQIPTVLILWEKIEDPEASYDVFKWIIDVQTSNPPELAEIALDLLKKRYGSQPHFNEKLRLTGLRSHGHYRGALSNFELLNHMAKGKFVFHTGGWGTGEILEISFLREELSLEFEKVAGRKDLSFENAFKNLIPLPDDHFLARRFGDPDLLEKEAREDPAQVIRTLLRDLGPKTAAEIKDEVCEWVIPEEDWSKWWQGARSRVKKDTLIESPSSLKAPFRLRASEVSHEDRFLGTLESKKDIEETIEHIYQHLRDFPQSAKSSQLTQVVKQRLEHLQKEAQEPYHKLQILFLEDDLGVKSGENATALIKGLTDVPSVIEQVKIAAFKKKALTLVRDHRDDWEEIFLALFFTLPHPTLREYILKELNTPKSEDKLRSALKKLLERPQEAPELFVWYFQRIVDDDSFPFGSKEGRCTFFEGFLTLMPAIEQNPAYRELVKKMHNILSAKRYAVVRKIIAGTDIEYLQEMVLLVSKCQSLSDHDVKILNSLAEVVQPSLAKDGRSKRPTHHEDVIWTTKEGFQKVQARIQHIGTVETVENAREIENARALGDLRENSEYKFALERRSRLQGELKTLSTQLQQARILTEQDIPKDEVGVGTVVDLENSQGQTVRYTLLGPWDADPDKNILSFQSKFAQTMSGKKVGESFQFQEEGYKIVGISNFFEMQHQS